MERQQSRSRPRKQKRATCSSCGCWTYGRKLCGGCQCDAGWSQEVCSTGGDDCKEFCDVVASHPLFAGPLQRDQFQSSPARSAGTGDLKGCKGRGGNAQKHCDASGTARRIPTSNFGTATNKSAVAEEAMRKHNKKLEAARKTLEDLQSKTTELEERRMEAYAELIRAQNGVVATRLAMSTAQDMGLDETDAQVRQAEAALTRAKEESAATPSKTNANECDASARAQAELDKAVDDSSRAVLGGKPAVCVWRGRGGES